MKLTGLFDLKTKIIIGMALFFLNLGGYGVVSWKSYHAGVDHQKALTAPQIAKAISTANAECEKGKQLSKEISNDYQNKIAGLNKRIADLKRLRPSVCVPVSAAAPGRNAATGSVASGQNGIDAGTLLDYAADAERYRLQLSSCQDFINRTWSGRINQ